jgi:Na+-driven multidrug efflux pump
MVFWGVLAGAALAVVVAALRWAYVPLFSPDVAVREQLAAVLVVVALFQPVCGVVFTLDGVLMGAGDGTFLAVAGVLTLLAFLPLAALVLATDAGLVALWWAFGGFLVARLVTLLWRERTDAWLVTGAALPERRRRRPA